MPKLIHALAEKEFIAFHIGFRNPKISRITRIKPNYKLMKLIEEQGANPDLITTHPETETLIYQEKVEVEHSTRKWNRLASTILRSKHDVKNKETVHGSTNTFFYGC